MKTQKYNWILYFISATIIMTIAVQFYWNYKNYQQNKQRVVNEIQISLDNALEQYFVDLSKETYFTIIDKNDLNNKKSIDKTIECFFPSNGKKKKMTVFYIVLLITMIVATLIIIEVLYL